MPTLSRTLLSGLTSLALALGCASLPSAWARAQAVKPVPPQWQLSHWVSADGMAGLVIDRTAAKPRIQKDGSKEILELTPQEDRDRENKLLGYHFLAPDGTKVLYLSVSGHWTLHQGQDDLALERDAAAAPLPAATLAGAPVSAPKVPQPWESLAADLKAVAVRTQWPQYAAEDSGNLAKVAQAVQAATPAMVVRFLADPKHTHHWAPASERIGNVEYSGLSGYYPLGRAWNPAQGGLEKHGGVLRGQSTYGSRANHLRLMRPEGYPPLLADGTPGLIWEVDATTVVFVTLDGGRYLVRLGREEMETRPVFAMGLPSADAWPAPLQHTLLGPEHVDYLSRAGILPRKAFENLEALDAAWDACVQKTWLGAKPELEALEQTSLDTTVREAKRQVILDRWAAKVEKEAAPCIAREEAALLAIIDARDQERLAMYEQAKRRLGRRND